MATSLETVETNCRAAPGAASPKGPSKSGATPPPSPESRATASACPGECPERVGATLAVRELDLVGAVLEGEDDGSDLATPEEQRRPRLEVRARNVLKEGDEGVEG
jgi:hypothetical protein